MNNGNNTWDVRFSHIAWFERLLSSHKNLTNVSRHDDIIFEADRIAQKDHLKSAAMNIRWVLRLFRGG